MEIITSVISFIGELFTGLFGAAIAFLTGVVTSLTGIVGLLTSAVAFIVGLYTGFFAFLSVLFPFIPADWFTLISYVLLATVFGVIIRKKVF